MSIKRINPKDWNARTTIGELYGPAMELIEQADADAYFELLLDHAVKHAPEKTREEHAAILRDNLGYYAGYYDAETRERVEHLYRCAHPIFGPIEGKREPTPAEAYELGLLQGRAWKMIDVTKTRGGQS